MLCPLELLDQGDPRAGCSDLNKGSAETPRISSMPAKTANAIARPNGEKNPKLPRPKPTKRVKTFRPMA